MSEERNQETAPKEGAAGKLSTASAPSVGRISAPLPPPRTIPFGPGVPTPPPPSRAGGAPSAAPPPPSRRPKPGAPPSSLAPNPDDIDEVEAAAVAEPSAPSQVSATALDSGDELSVPQHRAPSSALHSAPSVPSVPGAPSLDHVFSADDEPESQDGSMLSAGRVLSQPVDKPKIDPSSAFDDDEDEETRVLDARELGLSRRVDSSLKSALRSSVAPPPPPGSRPVTQGPPSRLSNAPPMSVPSVRPPSAMPPPSVPPSGFGAPSRRPHVPPAAPAPGSHPLSSSGFPPGFAHPEASVGTLSQPPVVARGSLPAAETPTKAKWPWVALLAALVAAAGTWFVLGSKGDLLVSVAGPNNASVSGVSIFVNGELKCSQSPCQVTGLKPGPYTVRAEAPGFVTSAEQAVKVESGSSAVANIQLKADASVPQLRVSATGAGLRVLVDGKDRGTAPLELSGLAEGSHVVRVEGPGFEAVEETVNIVEGTPVSVGPLNPKLVRGSLRIELGDNAEGAQVLVNGKGIRSLPATVELDAAEKHEVLVRKIGYSDFQRAVTFSPEQPKIDLLVNLDEGTSELGSGRAAATPRSDNEPESTPPAEEEAKPSDEKPDEKPDFLSAIKGNKEPAKPAEKTEKPQAGGKGTLNINSVPPTTVLLDGRPLGKTPKAGISVPAGSHSITFVHPEKGRKSVKVDVPSGGSKNVTVRL